MIRITNFIVAFWLMLQVGGLVLPSAANAECAQWDARGKITFVQNNGFRVDFDFTQSGSELHGTGSHIWDAGAGPFTITGSVDGSIKGDYFEITAYWWNSTTGVYTGHVGPQGRIEGSTYDKQTPRSMALWYSERTLRCMPVAGSTPETGGMEFPGDPTRDHLDGPSKGDPSGKKAFVAFCKDYANKAVAAARESQELSCGNDGPRWSTDVSAHLDWCMALNGDKGPPDTETAARASALDPCREQIARRGEIVAKPNIPSGDLTKPVPPPSSVPLPQGGTKGFLNGMKP